MINSKVDIANKALYHLGMDRITSLNDTNSKSSRVMQDIFEVTHHSLLETEVWAFALKRATLQQLSQTNLTEYDYVYSLPTDMVRVCALLETENETYEELTDEPYMIENDYLYTNQSEISIKYVYEADAPAKWTHLYGECLALALAKDACMALTNSISLYQKVEAQYQKAFYDAKNKSYYASGVKEQPTDQWIDET